MLFLQARASVGSYYTTRRSTRGATHSSHAPNLLGWVWRTRSAPPPLWGHPQYTNQAIEHHSGTSGLPTGKQSVMQMHSCMHTAQTSIEGNFYELRRG